MRVLINVASQYVSACILNLPRHFLHRPDGTLRALLFGLQGGGVYVNSGGVANFQDCNIHENTASADVCLHLRTFPELSSIAPVEC